MASVDDPRGPDLQDAQSAMAAGRPVHVTALGDKVIKTHGGALARMLIGALPAVTPLTVTFYDEADTSENTPVAQIVVPVGYTGPPDVTLGLAFINGIAVKLAGPASADVTFVIN